MRACKTDAMRTCTLCRALNGINQGVRGKNRAVKDTDQILTDRPEREERYFSPRPLSLNGGAMRTFRPTLRARDMGWVRKCDLLFVTDERAVRTAMLRGCRLLG